MTTKASYYLVAHNNDEKLGTTDPAWLVLRVTLHWNPYTDTLLSTEIVDVGVWDTKEEADRQLREILEV